MELTASGLVGHGDGEPQEGWQEGQMEGALERKKLMLDASHWICVMTGSYSLANIRGVTAVPKGSYYRLGQQLLRWQGGEDSDG